MLVVFCASLLSSIVGAWAINWAMERADAPVRFLEQSRGLRVAFAVFWAYTALSLAAPGRARWVVAAAWAAVFALFVAGEFRQIRAGPPALRRDLAELSDWARGSTPEDSVFVFVTRDAFETADENIFFKALARRGLAYSYDAAHLLFTRRDALPEAKSRMDAIADVRAGRLSLAELMRTRGIDFAVVNRGEVPAGAAVAHANETYCVVRR
jgi:hypothetical protein